MAVQKKNHEALNVEEALTKSEAFLIKNRNALIGAVLLVVLLIGGIVAYKNLYAAPHEEKAQTALFPGQQYFEAGSYELALNGDSLGSYTGFLKVAEEYSGTNAANLAQAYIGLCYAHLGQYDEALKALDGFSAKDLMVAPAIKGAIGNCYAQLGQLDKAVSLLKDAADEADNNTLSPIFLKQAGQLLENQGKNEAAVKLYTRLKEKYPNSYPAMDVDKYIDQAKLK
ncbi:MAG: tetratricopeptide repeat protein [Prevotellaceae bacterium]|jgi:tetratricopeptide (TPR) repeat protein|nr:tetratricopeptide repeat protein [Prevotellaceae bacterium]